MALLRENLDDIAVREPVPQRNDLAVYLCANTLITYFRVNGVRKINRRGAAREREHLSFRGECIDLFRVEVDLQRRHEFRRLLHFSYPFD